MRGRAATIGSVLLVLLAAWSHREVLPRILSGEAAAAWRPGTGQEVLPAEARAAIALLRRNEVASYALRGISPEADMVLFQRLVEGGYPMRLAATARHVLSRDAGPMPAGCVEIDREERLRLARCP